MQELNYLFAQCDLNDHKVESAVDLSTDQLKLSELKPIGILVETITYNSVKSLARLIAAEGINLYCLDISGNFTRL